jgi:isoprenylcysteine carboxyl methyltransferase (ICMT) family protein YpbQ
MRSRELILVEKPIFQILSEVNYFLVIVPELDDLPIFAIHESKTKMLVLPYPRDLKWLSTSKWQLSL